MNTAHTENMRVGGESANSNRQHDAAMAAQTAKQLLATEFVHAFESGRDEALIRTPGFSCGTQTAADALYDGMAHARKGGAWQAQLVHILSAAMASRDLVVRAQTMALVASMAKEHAVYHSSMLGVA